MHEFSLATQIVDTVHGLAEARRPERVRFVRLRVGELTCIDTVPLQFMYRLITRETLMENSTLEIEPVPASIRCSHCGFQGRASPGSPNVHGDRPPSRHCPRCGHLATAIQGNECEIQAVQFQPGGAETPAVMSNRDPR